MYLDKEKIKMIAKEARGIKKVDEITMTKESEEMVDFTETKIEEIGGITMKREEILRQQRELDIKLKQMEKEERNQRKADLENALQEKIDAIEKLKSEIALIKDDVKDLKKELKEIDIEEAKERIEEDNLSMNDEIIVKVGSKKFKTEKIVLFQKMMKSSIKVVIGNDEKNIKFIDYIGKTVEEKIA